MIVIEFITRNNVLKNYFRCLFYDTLIFVSSLKVDVES